jgi:ornithine cyclodeaminase
VKNFSAFDLDPDRARQFREDFLNLRPDSDFGGDFEVAGSLEELLGKSGLVAFATTAVIPHVEDLSACSPGTTILHVSLRDLAPEIILKNHNMVDDFGHVCRARTSIHLASEHAGDDGFFHADLGDVLTGKAALPPVDDKHLRIFSPFGLGILDLAVAAWVYQAARERSLGTILDSFLPG